MDTADKLRMLHERKQEEKNKNSIFHTYNMEKVARAH